MRPQSTKNARTTAEVFSEVAVADYEDEKLDWGSSARRLLVLAVTLGLGVLVNWMAG